MVSSMKNSLEDISFLKSELVQLKELIVKMHTCCFTLEDRLSKLLWFAEIDKNGITKMEGSSNNDDNMPFASYIKQLLCFLHQSIECHEEYSTFSKEVREQYNMPHLKCSQKKQKRRVVSENI